MLREIVYLELFWDNKQIERRSWKKPKNRDCLNKSCVSNAKTWEPVLKLTHVSLLIILKFYISLFMDVNRSSHLILIFPFWTKWYNDKMTRNSVTWPLETDLFFLCKGMTVDRLRHFRFHKYLKITNDWFLNQGTKSHYRPYTKYTSKPKTQITKEELFPVEFTWRNKKHLHLWKENDNHMVIKRKILQFKAGSFFLFSFFLFLFSYRKQVISLY